jgi:uncharacterized lipoprotein YehR (DUF1307 family)
MTKYLQTLVLRIQELKKGMTLNMEQWKSMPETPEELEMEIKEIEDADKDIAGVKEQLSMKQERAREIRDKKKALIQKIEKRAIGIHADELEKLEEYNIRLKRTQ